MHLRIDAARSRPARLTLMVDLRGRSCWRRGSRLPRIVGKLDTPDPELENKIRGERIRIGVASGKLLRPRVLPCPEVGLKCLYNIVPFKRMFKRFDHRTFREQGAQTSYREVSSLTHAFKRWTGTTPRRFRSGQPHQIDSLLGRKRYTPLCIATCHGAPVTASIFGTRTVPSTDSAVTATTKVAAMTYATNNQLKLSGGQTSGGIEATPEQDRYRVDPLLRFRFANW